MNPHFHYIHKQGVEKVQPCFQLSKIHMLSKLHASMLERQLPVYSVDEALTNIEAAGDDLAWLGGETFLALVTMGTEWHSPGIILSEEAVGPKAGYDKIDVDEFLAGMLALAEYLGCYKFHIGTLANPKQSAFTRLLASKGMTVASTTLYRNTSHGKR